MKYFSFLLSITLFLFTPMGAKANVFIEPYIGYQAGRLASTTNAGSDATGNIYGTAFGARLGYAVPLLFAALDYTYATDSASGMSPNLSDGNGTRSSLGVVAGVKIPLLRAYAGYGFLDSLKLTQTSADQTFKGTSLKFGVSFTGLPFIDLNFEYVMSNYTSFDPNNFSKASDNSALVTVSLPWEF